MNLTSARVLRGQSGATFDVTTPQWSTGLASLDRGSLARPVYLKTSPPDPTGIRYGCYFALASPDNTYSWLLVTGNATDNTLDGVVGRLIAQFESSARQHPAFAEQPTLYAEESVGDDEQELVHMVLVLPPHTAFYCTNEELLKALGYEGHPDLDRQTRDFGGKNRLKLRTGIEVYGFFNTKDRIAYYDGKKMADDEELTDDRNVPASHQLQLERLAYEERPLPHHGPLLLDTRDGLVRALDGFGERIAVAAQLRASPLHADRGVRDVATLSSAVLDDANLTLTLGFSEEMERVFDFPRGRRYTFVLDTEKTYYLKVPRLISDPFRDYYPVTLKMSGHAPAHSHVLGQGFCSVLGVLKGSDSAVAEGALFRIHQAHLDVEFLDYAGAPVVFESDTVLNLMLKFSNLS
jgi:hypothetical protein